MGCETYFVNYFSDPDTLKSANHVFSMQANPLMPDFRDGYSRGKLVDFAVGKLSGKVEDVLLTSSVGSDWAMVERLEKYFKILGNSSKQVKKSRDWSVLKKIFDKFKINYPKTLIFDGFDSLGGIDSFHGFKFPAVIKPSVEKEFQIKLVNNEIELNNLLFETQKKFNACKKKLHGKILVQEFIPGAPVSASVLSDGKESVTVSVNKQLIGLSELNSPGRFTYCGHVTPLDVGSDLTVKISGISNKIISGLGLVGSVGIDFVVSGSDVYFMEINPRFQDTLEAVERYRSINLVEKHIEACKGKLNKNLDLIFLNRAPGKFFAKGVLFSDKKIKAGNLNALSGIKDIPPEGAIINEGEPVCTIFVSGENEPDAVKNLLKSAGLIKNEFIII
jgi:hypothetical protein